MHIYRAPMHIMDTGVGAFCAEVEIFISVVYNITIVLKSAVLICTEAATGVPRGSIIRCEVRNR